MTDAKTQRQTSSKRLTELEIRAWLRKPGAEALHDGNGLYLRRKAKGGAQWFLRQVNPLTKARTWAALFPGVSYPEATLQAARERANEARKRANETQTDLVRERAAQVAAKRAEIAAAELTASRRVTVRQLFERWAATELAPGVGTDGRRTGRKDAGAFTAAQFERRVFPKLGDVAAPAVTKADVMLILDAVKGEGKRRTANVLLADLRQMFRFALVREIVDRNPLDTLSKRDAGGKETERERVLSDAEIKALAKAVPKANMGARSTAAIWLILSTACRVGEAMSACWEHVNTEARTWHLPQTKNERPHQIHLSAFALWHIEALQVARDAALIERRKTDPDARPSPWLFPNKAGDMPVCIKSLGKQLSDRQREPERRMKHRSKAAKALVLQGGRWTLHDLRRTAATLLAELGISGDTIDECMNHQIESRVRRTYIRDRRLADQARAFDALGARLAALVDGTGEVAANVVALKTPAEALLFELEPMASSAGARFHNIQDAPGQRTLPNTQRTRQGRQA